MNLKKMAGIGKRVFLSLTLTGMVLYGGGCSFKSMGAYLLSDLLTGGSISQAAGTTSGLDSLVSGLLGAAT